MYSLLIYIFFIQDCVPKTWSLPICNKFCNCKDNKVCDTTTGACPNYECEAGFGGTSCDTLCGVVPFEQKFGYTCQSDCHCRDKQRQACNGVTGVCNAQGCDQGWKNLLTSALKNCQTRMY